MGWRAVLAALALTASAAPDDDPLDNAARFCAPDQAFGIKFGSVVRPNQPVSARSNLIALPAQFRPFSIAEVVLSPRGRRRYIVHGQADFESSREAEYGLERVRTSLIATGWIVPAPKANGEQERSLYSKPSALDQDNPKGLVAELFTLGSRLYFSCTDAALAYQARREVRPPPLANTVR